jgi:hypothetical protein
MIIKPSNGDVYFSQSKNGIIHSKTFDSSDAGELTILILYVYVLHDNFCILQGKRDPDIYLLKWRDSERKEFKGISTSLTSLKDVKEASKLLLETTKRTSAPEKIMAEGVRRCTYRYFCLTFHKENFNISIFFADSE